MFMSAMSPKPTASPHAPGTAQLLAAGCGTAIASVCALGLFRIERLLGGLWSVAAVLCAGAVCFALARIFARLAAVLPTGAGLLAYLARGLGRPAGLSLVLPYFLLTLFLAGAEATVVGLLWARLLPVPPALGALAFLLGTWACCRAGVRISYRAQALATWALVLGLSGLSLTALAGAAGRGDLAFRLLPATPDVGRFVAAVGQALFLFMGFELLTAQVEVARTPSAVGRALTGSVAVLAGFYALLSLGFSCLPDEVPAGTAVPQLALAERVGEPVVLLIAGLSLLASFTSFNGALLGLSRVTGALASQGLLPRALGVLDPRTLVPRAALAFLLALALAATALVGHAGALQPSILAGAVAAALVYAGCAWVRQRPPFREESRPVLYRIAGDALALGLVALALGVLADAGPALAGTLALLGAATGAALVVARSARRPVRPTVLVPVNGEGATNGH
jgi:APA family basic amino acid/polyamine antiporter